MKNRGFLIEKFYHDEKQYVFEYCPPTNHPKILHNFTVPISLNGLFKFRTKTGYSSFMRHASRLQSSFNDFCSTSRIIPSDGDYIFDYYRPVTPSPDKTRENTAVLDTTREKRKHIALENPTFKSTPVSTVFHSNTPDILHEDIVPSSYRRKQVRLLTAHEKLGHLSFSTLRLMAKCGIIPQDLQYVDPPTCPGCAYGKAHRKPTRSKGANNLKHLQPTTFPGQVVSAYQLVSPTLGFVPCHRGIPTTKGIKVLQFL